jgi:hypothetical protein
MHKIQMSDEPQKETRAEMAETRFTEINFSETGRGEVLVRK